MPVAEPSPGLGAPAGERVPPVDYDAEASRLLANLSLGRSGAGHGPPSPMDAIWQHPLTGAVLYVGGRGAARDLGLLWRSRITRVANCTDSLPQYHDRSGGGPVAYFRFDVGSHRRVVRNDAEAARFCCQMIEWVGAALLAGAGVLVHCREGAHRAGTSGCILLMHFAGLSAAEALAAARRCRPVIAPTGGPARPPRPARP